MLQEGADLSEGVATVAPYLVVLAAKSSEDVVLPTIAGAAPLADFAEVAAGILFPADLAGSVTSAVADSAVAGILFPADPDGILFPADTAGILFPADTVRTDTADVVFLADAEEVTVGLADLADAGIRFPADPSGTAAADVAFLADADPVTMGVTDLADAGAVPLAAPDMTFPEIEVVTVVWRGDFKPERMPCYDGRARAE